jgi:hypothetical protein
MDDEVANQHRAEAIERARDAIARVDEVLARHNEPEPAPDLRNIYTFTPRAPEPEPPPPPPRRGLTDAMVARMVEESASILRSELAAFREEVTEQISASLTNYSEAVGMFVGEVRRDLEDWLEAAVEALQIDVTGLQNNEITTKAELEAVRAEVAALRSEVDTLRSEVEYSRSASGQIIDIRTSGKSA